MPNTNELNSVFSMAVEQQLKTIKLPRAGTQECQNNPPTPPPQPIALALKSLAAFIFKYVLSDLYIENRRGSVNRLGSTMTVMFGNV